MLLFFWLEKYKFLNMQSNSHYLRYHFKLPLYVTVTGQVDFGPPSLKYSYTLHAKVGVSKSVIIIKIVVYWNHGFTSVYLQSVALKSSRPSTCILNCIFYLNGWLAVHICRQGRGACCPGWIFPYLGMVGRLRGDDPRFVMFSPIGSLFYTSTQSDWPRLAPKNKSVCLYHI